jgi:hypothetical protein
VEPVTTLTHRLNPAAFRAPQVGDPGIGAEGQNQFTGPGINNTNLALLMEFRVKERHNFQLRLDAFNAFNHTQFNGINGSLNFDAPGSTNVKNAAANILLSGTVSGQCLESTIPGY